MICGSEEKQQENFLDEFTRLPNGMNLKWNQILADGELAC
jgi:hypothetical protein